MDNKKGKHQQQKQTPAAFPNSKSKKTDNNKNERPAEQTVLPTAPPSIPCPPPSCPVANPSTMGYVSTASGAGIKTSQRRVVVGKLQA